MGFNGVSVKKYATCYSIGDLFKRNQSRVNESVYAFKTLRKLFVRGILVNKLIAQEAFPKFVGRCRL